MIRFFFFRSNNTRHDGIILNTQHGINDFFFIFFCPYIIISRLKIHQEHDYCNLFSRRTNNTNHERKKIQLCNFIGIFSKIENSRYLVHRNIIHAPFCSTVNQTRNSNRKKKIKMLNKRIGDVFTPNVNVCARLVCRGRCTRHFPPKTTKKYIRARESRKCPRNHTKHRPVENG